MGPIALCVVLAVLLVAGVLFLAIDREPFVDQVGGASETAGPPQHVDPDHVTMAQSQASRTLVSGDEGKTLEAGKPRLLTDKRETHWPDGTLRESGEWSDGKRIGMHRTWHQNGRLASEVFWDRHNGRRGIARFYHENGGPFIVGCYANGMRDGTWTEYYADGTLRSVGAYVQRICPNGLVESKRDGYWEFRDPLGRVEEHSGIYHFGDRVGSK